MEGQGTGGPNLEPRVKRLEHSVESIHVDMAQMQKSLTTISSQVGSFTKTLDSVAEKLDVQRTKRPELSAMAAVTAVIIAIGGAVMWPVNDRINRTWEANNEQRKAIIELAVMDGEARADRRHYEMAIRRLQERVDRLHEQN